MEITGIVGVVERVCLSVIRKGRYGWNMMEVQSFNEPSPLKFQKIICVLLV